MIMHHSNRQSGITVIEIVVSVAVISVGLVAVLGLGVFSLIIASVAEQSTDAALLAQEAIEAARSFRDNTDWAVDGVGTLARGIAYHPIQTGSPPQWNVALGTEVIGIFERSIIFREVVRDGNGDISSSGAGDGETALVEVLVSWTERGRSHEVQLETFITDWTQ